MPRGTIEILCTGSAPCSISAISAWPTSWCATRSHHARRHGRDLLQISVLVQLDGPRMNLKHREPARPVGPIYQHLTVEPTGAQQRRVQNLWPVGRGHEDDPRP